MNPKLDGQVRSDACVLAELMLPFGSLDEARTRLVMRDNWASRWTAAWQINGSEVVWPVRDLGQCRCCLRRQCAVSRGGRSSSIVPAGVPGLDGAEARLRIAGGEGALLALDFMTVIEVLPQPFALTFEHVDGHAGHIPDFLAVLGDGGHWLLDIRPAGLVGELDAVKFAAAHEAGRLRLAVLGDHRLATARPLGSGRAVGATAPDDGPAGLPAGSSRGCRQRAVTFGELVQATRFPAVGRAHAVHLLWHRWLGFDMGRPLGDSSLVWPAGWTELR